MISLNYSTYMNIRSQFVTCPPKVASNNQITSLSILCQFSLKQDHNLKCAKYLISRLHQC